MKDIIKEIHKGLVAQNPELLEDVIKDAMRFAITTALGDACTVGGYVVDDWHVESFYKAWRKS